eukprot:COSAG01_NODE_7430_length_3213_cov_2.737636_1_plen_212_part_00
MQARLSACICLCPGTHSTHHRQAWEGGVRVAAFIGGGWSGLPRAIRGTTVDTFLHLADFYPTLCRLLGVDAADDALINGTRYKIDGVDIWNDIIGGGGGQQAGHSTTRIWPARRSEWLPVTEHSLLWYSAAHNTTFKLLTVAQSTHWYLRNGTQIPDTGQEWPCVTNQQVEDSTVEVCFVCHPTNPCLFDLIQDPAVSSVVSGFCAQRSYP